MVEDLNSLISKVIDAQPALCILTHLTRFVEFTGPDALPAPLQNESAFFVKLLNAVGRAVGNIDEPIVTGLHSARQQKLSRSDPSFSPCVSIVALAIKYNDAGTLGVEYEDARAVSTKGDSHRSAQRPIRFRHGAQSHDFSKIAIIKNHAIRQFVDDGEDAL